MPTAARWPASDRFAADGVQPFADVETHKGTLLVAPRAADILNDMLMRGRFSPCGKLDYGCMRSLSSIPPDLQVVAAERLDAKLTPSVRNPSAFFETIIDMERRTASMLRDAGNDEGLGAAWRYGACGDGSTGRLLPARAVPANEAQSGSGCAAAENQASGAPANTEQLKILHDGWVACPAKAEPGGDTAGTTSSGPAFAAAAEAEQPAAMRQHYGLEQVEWGVRVSNFHELSAAAPFVHPAIAKKLQDMWDGGSPLLAFLDDRTWEALTELQPSDLVDGLAALQEAEIARLAREAAVKRGAASESLQLDIDAINDAYQGSASKRLAPAAAAATSPAQGGCGSRSIFAASAAVAHPLPLLAAARPDTSSSGKVGGGSAAALPPDIPSLVQAAVARSRGGLQLEHFNIRVMEALSDFRGTPLLQTIMARIEAADMWIARSPAAFLMGIITRCRHEEKAAAAQGAKRS